MCSFFAFIFPLKQISCKLENCEMGCQKLLPFVRCLKPYKSSLAPVPICSLLPSRESRSSSNTVITIRLLLKSLPNPGGICLLFTFSTTVWCCRTPDVTYKRSARTISGGGRTPGSRGRQEAITSNTDTHSKVNDLCILRSLLT